MEVFKLYDVTKRFQEINNNTPYKGYYFQQDGWAFHIHRIGIPQGGGQPNLFSVETERIEKIEVASYLEEGDGFDSPTNPYRHYEPKEVVSTLIQLEDFTNPEYVLFNNYIDAINHISKDGFFQIERLD